MVGDGRLERAIVAGLNVERGGDDLGHTAGITQRCEFDQGHAILDAIDDGRCGPHRHSGFTDPARSDDGNERLRAEGFDELLHLGITADQRGRPVQLWCAHDGTPGYRVTGARHQERGVGSEDPCFQLDHRSGRIEADVQRQLRPVLGGASQGLSLSTRSMQRQHQQPPVGLTERVALDERFEFADHGGWIIDGQSCFGPGIGGHEPELVQAQRLRPHLGGLWARTECPAPPERQGGVEQRHCGGRILDSGSMEQGLEPIGIELAVDILQSVAARGQHDLEAGCEQRPDARDLALHGGRGRRGWLVSPQCLDETGHADLLTSMCCEDGEHLLGLRATGRAGFAADLHLDASEYPEHGRRGHRSSVSHDPCSTHAELRAAFARSLHAPCMASRR